jgi:hypothetical protein
LLLSCPDEACSGFRDDLSLIPRRTGLHKPGLPANGEVLLQGQRADEELLGGHGEELGLVAGSVGVKERLVVLLSEAAQALNSREQTSTH